MSEYILELKDVVKTFGGVKALNGVHFQLKRGEIHALMGENGAGKSTFIKVITGVHQPDSGIMLLDGEQVTLRNTMDSAKLGIAAIYQHVTAFPDLTVTENIVDDGDWKDKWKEFFKPTKVTDRIVVKPTWEEYTPKEDELVIEIDPGMAFGTGTHETTSLCMKLMEKYLGEHPEEKKILDVGCGSGILSICGALLGSREILGIEIDEDAVRVAHENVEENHVEDAVKVMQGDLTKGVDFKADVIVANLMADLVMLLSEDARKHLTEDGIFISSGILVEKEEMVSAAIREAGFRIVEIAEDGEWCAIAAVPEV